jgi:tRNA(Met) cytidine acetyltransferase
MHPWLSFFSNLSIRAKHKGHRQVIIMSGHQDWAWAIIGPWLDQRTNNVLIGLDKPTCIDGVKTLLLSPKKPSNLLGYECENVIFNAHQGLYPDALTAVAGTLVCGGIFFILCPDVDVWPNHEDGFAQNRLPHTQNSDAKANNFHMVTRLLNKTQQHNIRILKEGMEEPTEPPRALSTLPWQPPTGLTTNQEQVLTHISTHLDTASFTHVITADRGRGKSHLLGNLINTLTNTNIDNGIKYYLTAPNKASCHAIYKALSAHNAAHTITFIPPESVLATVKPNDVLFIDEAASIPINLLIKFSQSLNKLIMATTTHGYEGTGKGFQFRFLKHLQTRNSEHSTHLHTLNTPIRYAPSDPLEHWLFDVFCLNSEPKGLALTKNKIQNPQFKPISQSQLHANDNLLQEVFGLLIQAHYQTRPSDLRDIIDALDFQLFGLFNTQPTEQHTLLAVCLVSSEGPILNSDSNPLESTLQQDIYNGIRRPKGHLMPQVLAHHMGLIDALNLKGARIVRIATLPNLQQQNLGSLLIGHLCTQLKSQQYDYIGSSFADTTDVTGFWNKNTFTRIRTGTKLDSASGTHSALVMKGLSLKGITLEEVARKIALNVNTPIKSQSDLSDHERDQLQAFLNYSGSYENAKQLLGRFNNWESPFPKKASREFKQFVTSWLNGQK